MATLDVSHVIQRRPYLSADIAVVPEPPVGSKTISPGSVDIRTHRSTTFFGVWTTYTFSSVKLPTPVSNQRFVKGVIGLSVRSEANRRLSPATKIRFSFASRSSP